MQVFLNMLRCLQGGSSWEKKWASFILDDWLDPSHAMDFHASNLVYCGTKLSSRVEYWGQTGTGLRVRLQGHIARTFGGRTAQKLYRALGKLDIHRFIWTPSWMWRTAVEKYHRMRIEGARVWARAPMLNTLGVERLESIRTRGGALLLGRRTRFRLVLRLKNKERPPVLAGVQMRRKEEARAAESVRRGRLLAMGMRLARRPWEGDAALWHTATARDIHEMSHATLKRLFVVMHTAMDTTARSIALHNVKLCLRHRHDVVFKHVKIESCLLGEKLVVGKLTKALRRWCFSWGKRAGVLVVLRVAFAGLASECTATSLVSTTKWGRKPREELVCPCGQDGFIASLPKWDGHVLAPLLQTMHQSEELPASWNVKSRLVPDAEFECAKVDAFLAKLHEEVSARVRGPRRRNRPPPSPSWAGAGLADITNHVKANSLNMPSEKMMRSWRAKLSPLVVTPVDRLSGQCAIV